MVKHLFTQICPKSFFLYKQRNENIKAPCLSKFKYEIRIKIIYSIFKYEKHHAKHTLIKEMRIIEISMFLFPSREGGRGAPPFQMSILIYIFLIKFKPCLKLDIPSESTTFFVVVV